MVQYSTVQDYLMTGCGTIMYSMKPAFLCHFKCHNARFGYSDVHKMLFSTNPFRLYIGLLQNGFVWRISIFEVLVNPA